MKQRAILLGLLCSGLVFALLMIEVALRFMPAPQKKMITDRPHRYYRSSHAPTMRGNEVNLDKKKEGLRIAIVGDSFTFGPKLQVYDTFPERLKWMLNVAHPQPPIEVLSYGTPGASTHAEVDLVERAIKADADIIILQITLNDAQERSLREEPAEFSGKGPPRGAERVFNALFGWSKVYRFVRQRVYNYLSVGRYIRYHTALFTEPRTWERFHTAVINMHQAAERNKRRFMAVLFPLFDFPLDENYPFKEVHRKIKKVFAERRIPFLDLEQSYYGLDPKRLQLIPGADSHPNEIGHRIAAEAIFAWLGQLRLLPAAVSTMRVYDHRDNVNESISRKKAIYPRKKSR